MTWRLIELAELYERGLPPVAGGVLDQTRYFVQAARMVWNDRNEFKARLAGMH